ncbi:MAG: hypothetical protein AAB532_00120, partial [Patescibacteria group bacterium]
MRERDGVPKPVQTELTTEALNPTLIAGDIFMPDERNESPIPPPNRDQALGDLAHADIDVGVRRAAADTQAADEELGVFLTNKGIKRPERTRRGFSGIPLPILETQGQSGLGSTKIITKYPFISTTSILKIVERNGIIKRSHSEAGFIYKANYS